MLTQNGTIVSAFTHTLIPLDLTRQKFCSTKYVSRTKSALKQKALLIIFNRFSLKKIKPDFLESESPTLRAS